LSKIIYFFSCQRQNFPPPVKTLYFRYGSETNLLSINPEYSQSIDFISLFLLTSEVGILEPFVFKSND